MIYSTKFCVRRDFDTAWYRKWRERLGFPEDRIHRKFWEDAIIAEAIVNRELPNLIPADSCKPRGIGFGVGSEQLPCKFADAGYTIDATDLLSPEWETTHRDFHSIAKHSGVTGRIVDMNWLQGEDGNWTIPRCSYDISWSACSMDHLGSVWLVKRFLLNQMNCLKVGGLAVHTAEYSFSPDMPRAGHTVWLSQSDILDIADLAVQIGHEMAPIDWFLGDHPDDHIVDSNAGLGPIHIKYQPASGAWGTSIVFMLTRHSDRDLWLSVHENEAREQLKKRLA